MARQTVIDRVLMGMFLAAIAALEGVWIGLLGHVLEWLLEDV